MHLSVKGKSKSLTLSETRFATRFFINLLFKDSPDIVPELEIDVYFQRMVDKGACNVEDDRDHDPRYFSFDVDNRLSRRQSLRTIAHEAVHAWQFATNQLKYKNDKRIVWKRKAIDTELVEYWDLPSEIDAFGREEGLYIRYLNHLTQHKIKFAKKK